MTGNFRQYWAFFVAGFKAQLRSPSAIFFGFFVPLIFLLSFAFFNNSGVKFEIGLVPNSSQEFSIFKESLKKSDIFKVQEGNKADLTKKLQKSDLDVIVEYGGSGKLEVTTNSSKAQNNPVILQTLGTLIDKITLGNTQPLYRIEEQSVNGRNGKYIDFVLPGILGFSLISAAVAGTSFSFVSLKKTYALKRLFAAPADPQAFIVGQSLSRLFFNLLQTIVLLAVAVTFFQYTPKDGIISLAQMMVVITFGLVVFLGLGYIVAGVGKSEDQVAPLSNLITLPQFLLAGTFFEVSGLPGWLQAIAKALPLYNFNEAMRYISLDGQYLWSTDVLIQLGFLTLWAIVIYFVASKVFDVKAS